MNKALLYNSAEGTNLKIFPASLFKDDFDSENYSTVENWEWSDILDRWIYSRVILVEKVKAASIWFEDGTCWDTHTGWRKHATPEADNGYVKQLYHELTSAQ